MRHRPKPSASGSSTSASVSRRTSVPVMPASAAPDSTYTGTSAGFTNRTDNVPSDDGTSSLRVVAGSDTAAPMLRSRLSDGSRRRPLGSASFRPARVVRRSGAGDEQLEVNTGVVVEPAYLPEIVHDMTALALGQRGVDRLEP